MLRNEMPIYDLCHPCSIEYDFVGKFETLEHDMNYITKKFKMPVSFPYREPSTNADYMRLYYHGVKVEHLNVLKTLYHKDFEVYFTFSASFNSVYSDVSIQNTTTADFGWHGWLGYYHCKII